MHIADIISSCSFGLACIAMLIGFFRDSAKANRHSAEESAKLDNIAHVATDIRMDVKDIRRTVNDHTARLSSIETAMSNHERRITRLEDHCNNK